MKVDYYLRVAYTLNNSEASTVRKNLEKMIELVLLDAEDYSQANAAQCIALNSSEIIEKLKDSYGLDFSENEVVNAIKHAKGKIVKLSGEPVKYAISPDTAKKFKNKIDENPFEKLVPKFLHYERENNSEVLDNYIEFKNVNEELLAKSLKSLLDHYFYALFNSNASYITSFLGKQYDTTELNEEDFTTQEKQILNDFVYWENPEKDTFVFNMVSCCFDYCMLNVKKEPSIYRTVFQNRVFYLDTNIIFRLIGINKGNRQKIISAFIKKCHSVGIALYVTNFTRSEVENTIDGNVNRIRNILGSNSPINTQMMVFYAGSTLNEDFYREYCTWCKEAANQNHDYESFKKDLKRKVSLCYRNNDIKYADSHTYKDADNYDDLVKSLISYKNNAHRNVTENSAEIDVSNYMFVQAQNSSSTSRDFFGIREYFISADHIFGNWAREEMPNAVPIIVLPSVWYSIILQYGGRNNSDDDYAAFTRFLNFSFNTIDNENKVNKEQKIAILKKVLALNEQEEIKNDILVDIEEKLKANPDEVDNFDDVDALVDEGYRSVTERKVLEARREEQEIARNQRASDKAEHNHLLDTLNNQKEAEINRLKADYKKNSEEEYKRYIEEETTTRTNKTVRTYWTVSIIIAVAYWIVILGIFYWILKQDIIDEKVKIIFDYLKWVIGGLFTLIEGLVLKCKFHFFNKDEIKKDLREQVRREHRSYLDVDVSEK